MLAIPGKPASINVPWGDPGLPAVQAYYERLSERPGFVAHGRNHAS